MKLTIEIELQPNMEQLLIDKINEYCQGWFNKKPVLHKADVSHSPVFGIFRYDDKGYVGYWLNREEAERVFSNEYDNGEWYVDEMCCQDCG